MAVKNISEMPSTKMVQDDLSSFFDTLQIKIGSFGKWKQTDVNNISGYTISDYELIYFLSGESVFTKNNRQYKVTPGHILLLEPFNMYSARCVDRQPVEYFYIHFTIAPYYLNHEFLNITNAICPVFDIDPEGVIKTMLSNTWQRRQILPLSYAFTVKMALIRILMRMAYYTIGDCDSYVRPQYSKDTLDIINGAIEMVTCNMPSSVKIKDIAASLNIKERKLYKHFEDMFGMSPSRYFTNFKIKKAEYMLLGTGMTLEQISEALGFSSPFHLSRVYKKVVDIPPSHTRARRAFDK